MIPFIDLKAQYQDLKSDIQSGIDGVLNHGQFIMGPEVAELEARLSAYAGCSHCISVASGTEALLISLMALDIGVGDEVITTPFTFVATAEAIVRLGAKPVFVDVEADTCNIDVSLLEAAITDRTRAIIPVSLYGQVADMDEINQIASRHGIVVVEDSAQSFGATYKDRKSGNLSALSCTSFFPSKPLGCYGDGGAIMCWDSSIATICEEIRVHGQSQRYVHTRLGVGGRMDTIQAAVLLAKLNQFDDEVKRRMEAGGYYNELFDAYGVERVQQREDRTSVFAQYTIFVDDRDQVREKLRAEGIPTAVHYPIPLNEQPAYRDLCCPDCTPIASQVAKRVMSLPMHPYLADEQQKNIVAAVVKVLDSAS